MNWRNPELIFGSFVESVFVGAGFNFICFKLCHIGYHTRFSFQRFVMRAVKWISNFFKNESVNARARSWVVSFDFFCFFRFSKLSLYFHCLIQIVRMCYYAKYNFHLDFLSFFYDLGDLLNQTHILMISTVLTLFYSSLID